MAHKALLHSDGLGQALQGVFSVVNGHLSGRVLVNELVDRKVASSDSNLDPSELNADHDSLRTEGVDSLRFSHEHNLELGPVGVVVDPFSQSHVHVRSSYGDVDRNLRSDMDHLEFQDL